jgi:hypothetical protein
MIACTHPKKFAKDPKTIRAAKTMTYFLATIIKDAPNRAKKASRFVMTTAGAFESHFPPLAPEGHPVSHKEAPLGLSAAG